MERVTVAGARQPSPAPGTCSPSRLAPGLWLIAPRGSQAWIGVMAQGILELDRGHAYPYQGNYTTYLETKSARMKVEGQKDAKRKREIERELAWVRSGAKARQAKTRARLARFSQLTEDPGQARHREGEAIRIPPGPRLGGLVIEARRPDQVLR